MDLPSKSFKVVIVVHEHEDKIVVGYLAQIFSDFKFVDTNTDDMPCRNVPKLPGVYKATINFYYVDEEDWHFELENLEDISNLKERAEQGHFGRYILDKDNNAYIWSDYHNRYFLDPEKMEQQIYELEELKETYEDQIAEIDEELD